MSTIYITGAHGFIGQHLVRLLASAGHTVAGVGHGLWPDSEARARGLDCWVNAEILPGSLQLLRRTVGLPQYVIHLAGGSSVSTAIANPREDFLRTVVTTAELLDWIRLEAPEAKLLAVSSAAVYGAGHVGQIGEESELRPYSPYGYHKRIMEEICLSYASSYGQRAVIARLFSVYGADLKKQLLWDICSRLASGADPLVLGGSGDELRDWTDVRDVTAALLALLDLAETSVPTFNVGTGHASTVRQVASAVRDCWTGSDLTPVPVVFNGEARSGDPFSMIARPDRLQSLGFRWRVGLQEGLANYVSWFRQRVGR
jgi:UDP-glucose 4-epimerase